MRKYTDLDHHSRRIEQVHIPLHWICFKSEKVVLREMVVTNGVLIVTVVWVDTLTTKRAVAAMERRADFITTVTRKDK